MLRMVPESPLSVHLLLACSHGQELTTGKRQRSSDTSLGLCHSSSPKPLISMFFWIKSYQGVWLPGLRVAGGIGVPRCNVGSRLGARPGHKEKACLLMSPHKVLPTTSSEFPPPEQIPHSPRKELLYRLFCSSERHSALQLLTSADLSLPLSTRPPEEAPTPRSACPIQGIVETCHQTCGGYCDCPRPSSPTPPRVPPGSAATGS